MLMSVVSGSKSLAVGLASCQSSQPIVFGNVGGNKNVKRRIVVSPTLSTVDKWISKAIYGFAINHDVNWWKSLYELCRMAFYLHFLKAWIKLYKVNARLMLKLPFLFRDQKIVQKLTFQSTSLIFTTMFIFYHKAFKKTVVDTSNKFT